MQPYVSARVTTVVCNELNQPLFHRIIHKKKETYYEQLADVIMKVGKAWNVSYVIPAWEQMWQSQQKVRGNEEMFPPST